MPEMRLLRCVGGGDSAFRWRSATNLAFRRLFAVSLVQFRNFRRKRVSKRVALLHLKRRKKNGKPENSFRMQRGKTTSSEVMRRHPSLLMPRCEP